MQYKIGDVIDKRPDGSTIYKSHKGIINCDQPGMVHNKKGEWIREDTLAEAKAEDRACGYNV